ncbi:hypothetical protein H4696_006150 [Amycolatopsis lexingtonensis]|uniref:Uncharacterized protein n=1 Tax=Amycolatopsis lexingtonensis TaxID=218822 RepID=A0ABR9I789_9PSEU|nr:hypothetical protein [Amycolatopsis lexingtonensis]MBE1499050.1 hypothetical protein [Amycolatopsis lexingtonensis]
MAAQTADAVVAEVSAATAVPLTLVTGYDDVAYAGVRGDTVVELFAGHGYDDDDDMPFGSHPFMVRFRNGGRSE